MINKFLLLSLAGLFAAGMNLYAQEPFEEPYIDELYYNERQYFDPKMEQYPHEVAIGYGWFSINDMYGIMDDLLPSLAEMGVATARSTGSISLGYTYEPINDLEFGAYFSYSGNMSNLNDRGTLFKNYYSIMPQVKYEWFHHRKITLYSRAAVGLLLVTIKNTSGDPDAVASKSAASVAFQLSPIGIEIGRSIAFFAEAGFGTTGIITFGVKKAF